MPVLVELQQLLDVALTTPELGTVNFNILRTLLYEMLKHLNIHTKVIDIDEYEDDLKGAYDFVRDGFVVVSQGVESGAASAEAKAETEPVETPVLGEAITAKEPTVSKESTTAVDTIVYKASTTPKEETPSKEPTVPKEPRLELVSKEILLSEDDGNSVNTPALLVDSVASPSPAEKGLTVKQVPSARSSIVMYGRSDSLKELKKKVAELQSRVEALESLPPPAPSLDPLRSVASLVRRESKTPAQDFVDLININRKLEASENSIDGLSEMVDALTTDVTELKDLLPSFTNKQSDLAAELQRFKKFVDKIEKDKKQSKEEDKRKQDEMGKRWEIMIGYDKKMENIDDAIASLNKTIEGISNMKLAEGAEVTGTPPGMFECLAKCETQDKMLQELKRQLLQVTEKMDADKVQATEVEKSFSSAMTKLEACRQELSNNGGKINALSEELKTLKSLIEGTELQIHQVKNNIALMLQERVQPEEPTAEEEPEPPRRRALSIDRDELSLIRTMIFDLQEEKDKLKQGNGQLSEELYKKQKCVDDLYHLVDELREGKADKDLLSMGFEMKADKREVDMKIGRDDFDQSMGVVDQSMKELLLRLDGHEDTLKQAMAGLSSDIGKKLDKKEVEPLKRYLEARMENLKPKPVEKPPPDEFAAGIRKQFLVDYSCISCDRPVKYAKEGTFPPLPTLRSLPGSKSNRPYTTFELEQIRQHMLQGGLAMTKERFEMLEKQRNKLQREILRLSGARNLQELAEVTERACGGVHTLTYPHSQAVVRGLQLSRDELDFLVPQKEFQPVDIMGQDGHIYKGLVDNLPPTLPHIPQKGKPSGGKDSPRSLRRSTTPASPSSRKVSVDEVRSP